MLRFGSFGESKLAYPGVSNLRGHRYFAWQTAKQAETATARSQSSCFHVRNSTCRFFQKKAEICDKLT